MTIRTALMNVMIKAARKAARGLSRDFGEVEHLQVSRKGPANFVTAADLKAEKILREELAQARPGYGFLLEEAGTIEGSDKTHRWIVDPLDGTTNFLHGLPHFAISIALERNDELVAGLVYDPIKDEMFIAERGQGAFVNDRRLRVSARSEINEALLATGIPYQHRPGHDRLREELAAVTDKVAGIRRFGSAALDLAYVAAGRYDGFWEHDLSPWDIAAGVVLVREAGGMVTNVDGSAFDLTGSSILAANEPLCQPLSRLLTQS